MKKVWLILGIMAGAGLLLMGVGVVQGAVPSLTIDENGVHVGEAWQKEQVGADALEGITGLDIETVSAAVVIMPAEQAGMDIESGANRQVTWSLHEGTLRVRQEGSFWSFLSLGFSWKTDTIKVYLPMETVLNSIRVQNSSGEISARALNGRSIELATMSGKVEASDIQAGEFSLRCASGKGRLTNCEAERMSLIITSGDIEADGLVTQGLSAVITSGAAHLAGDFLGETSLDVTSGSCTLEGAGALQDYSRWVSATSGTVKINDKNVSGNEVDAGAPHKLRLKVTSGTVTVRLAE